MFAVTHNLSTSCCKWFLFYPLTLIFMFAMFSPFQNNITPLHVASRWGKSNMVQLLLENKAVIDEKTRDGLTPLHCAARSGHEAVVDLLLEREAPHSSKTKVGFGMAFFVVAGLCKCLTQKKLLFWCRPFLKLHEALTYQCKQLLTTTGFYFWRKLPLF